MGARVRLRGARIPPMLHLHHDTDPYDPERERRAEIALLRRVQQASGLSARRFARRVLDRNERTVRRWLAGDADIPPDVLAFLRHRDVEISRVAMPPVMPATLTTTTRTRGI